MSITVTYADWLANYSPRQYKNNTVRTYVSALEKAPSRLGITLEKPIMEHLSIKEFNALYQYLTGLKNYTAVNKGYGNGELSAALSAFKKYLVFLEKMGSIPCNESIYSPAWFAEQAKNLVELREKDALLRHSFVEQFGPDAISKLSGKDLLTALFYSDVENKTIDSNSFNSLALHEEAFDRSIMTSHWLEQNRYSHSSAQSKRICLVKLGPQFCNRLANVRVCHNHPSFEDFI